MTTEEIERAKALADAATKGPWSACGHSRAESCICGLVWTETGDFTVAKAHGTETDDGSGETTVLPVAQVNANARFIAAARTLVPQLCDEVLRLRAALRGISQGTTDVAAEKAAVHALLETK